MKTTGKVAVAVIGASGYVGGELLRLIAIHPRMELTAATSEKSVGSSASSIFPHLASLVSLSFEELAPEAIAKRADAVFLALPHTKSFLPVAACLEVGTPVVDLSADYRLKSPRQYETWYQTSHPMPDLLRKAVYGLPELHRAEIRSARLVASPGCYPTAAILQLAPLAANGLIEPGTIVIDAKSGLSGAGRSPALPYHFPEAHESVEPYKIGQHRHIPEIEQELSWLVSQSAHKEVPRAAGEHSPAEQSAMPVAFTPHLVPMNRGILSTAYCRLTRPIEVDVLRTLYRDYYAGERFIRLQTGDAPANPRHVRGSNFCDLAIFTDNRTGWIVTTAALDNLVKGAAGQAIQAMNLMLGFPEETGLLSPGVFP